MKELVQKVKQWGIDRGLDKVGHLAQAKYTLKKTAELLDAYADSNIGEINDAIGDILVTLIVGASNDESTWDKFAKELYTFMEFREHHVKNGAFKFKNLTGLNTIRHLVGTVLFLNYKCNQDMQEPHHYIECVDALYCVAFGVNNDFNQSLSLHDCLQLAYDEIKDRKGTLINGQFIKD